MVERQYEKLEKGTVPSYLLIVKCSTHLGSADNKHTKKKSRREKLHSTSPIATRALTKKPHPMGLMLLHQLHQLPKHSRIQFLLQLHLVSQPAICLEVAPRPRPLEEFAPNELLLLASIISYKTHYQPIDTCQHGDELAKGRSPTRGLWSRGSALPTQEVSEAAKSVLLLTKICLEGGEGGAGDVLSDLLEPTRAHG